MSDGGDPPPPIGTDQVDRQLVEAIQDGRLRPATEELSARSERLDPASRARVAAVREALAAIDAAVESERGRLTACLARAGVEARSPGSGERDRPLHAFALEIDPSEADRAAGALEAAGYRRLGPTEGASWRAFRATRRGCPFVRADREPFRVKLSWSPGGGAGGPIARRVAPHPGDFDAVALPTWLWPAYIAVHLLRRPLRHLLRRRDPPDLGPYLETPAALIEPLLRFADLSGDDLLVDLGCGDGRLPVEAARVFGCRARGVETDPDLVDRARAAAAAAGLGERVEIVRADASSVPLDDATVVVAFLPVATVAALLPSVLRRLPAGARFVVHEQERLRTEPAHARAPLISPGGISVAHRWNV